MSYLLIFCTVSLLILLRRVYEPLRRLEVPLTAGDWLLLAGLILYATALDLTRVAHGMLG